MTATGKITTSEIARQIATRKDVRILVRIDPDTGTVHATDRKTGAAAATITKVNMVTGNRKRLYKLWTNAGPIAGAYPGNVTHWLPRAKDTDAPDSNVTESTTFEHQASDDGGKTWRTVAVGLDVAGCDAIRWDHYGEGTRFRFVADVVTTVHTADEIEAYAAAMPGGSRDGIAQPSTVIIAPNHAPAEPVDTDTWTERYSAGWSDGEVTVVRDVRAGICGPFGTYPAADLDEAEQVLRANGYVLSGPWSEHTNGFFAPLATYHTRDEIEAYAAAMPGGSREGIEQAAAVIIAPNHAPAVGDPTPRPEPADGFGPVDEVYAPGDRVGTVDGTGRTSVGIVVEACDPVFKDGRPVQPWDTAYTVRVPVSGEIYKDTTGLRRELPIAVGQTWTSTNSRGEPSTMTIGSIEPDGLVVNGVGFKPRGIALSSYSWAQITSGPHTPIGTVRRCDVGGEELTGPYWLLHGLGRGWEGDRGAACAFHAGQPEPEAAPDAGPTPRDGYARAIEASGETVYVSPWTSV